MKPTKVKTANDQVKQGFQIRFPEQYFTVEDIAVFLICDVCHLDDNQITDYIKEFGKRQIDDVVKSVILSYGTETPSYRVGDYGKSDLTPEVIAILNEKFAL